MSNSKHEEDAHAISVLVAQQLEVHELLAQQSKPILDHGRYQRTKEHYDKIVEALRVAKGLTGETQP